MSRKRILIVDDDLVCSRILKAGLEKTESYDVQTEDRAMRALSVAREFGPDLVLLDVCMLDGDGGEVAFNLRSDKRLQHIPIIFMTSIVSEHEAQNGNAIRGSFPFLAKPVRLEKVIDCIERHIGTGRPGAQLSVERKSP
jgi:chemosensory pili system protein ChpA (sensor histidine kinase/response regulator)